MLACAQVAHNRWKGLLRANFKCAVLGAVMKELVHARDEKGAWEQYLVKR
jgi:hypothetical protein